MATSITTIPLRDTEVTTENIKKSEQILTEYGITNPKEALQRIGHMLLNTELYPESKE